MVRTTFVDDNGIKKGAWSEEEDAKLRAYIQRYGHWNWRLLPKFAGLARTGKSCRLRWVNYLKPGLKRGNFSQNEHDLILKLHTKLGKKWSAMALELPGRTDNEIKNYWYGHISKRHPAGRTIRNKELVIEPAVLENLLLESYEVPNCQENSSIHNEELVSPHSSSDDSTAESETPNFWTRPFELDTDTYIGEKSNFWTRPFELDTDTYIGEKSSFWADLPPLHTDIYAQDSNFPPFLEEDLLSLNARYNDFSNFDYAVNPFLIHSWQNDSVISL